MLWTLARWWFISKIISFVSNELPILLFPFYRRSFCRHLYCTNSAPLEEFTVYYSPIGEVFCSLARLLVFHPTADIAISGRGLERSLPTYYPTFEIPFVTIPIRPYEYSFPLLHSTAVFPFIVTSINQSLHPFSMGHIVNPLSFISQFPS